jgi:hypothetical protein
MIIGEIYPGTRKAVIIMADNRTNLPKWSVKTLVS